ncbi:MAG: peptidoglycan DD-metalloendopeptidase family protein [Acidimicrobiales bacterium]|nr:peptidoglycan DD-metalloendopeptidase family protein [Acidimicrobiales bacterium]
MVAAPALGIEETDSIRDARDKRESAKGRAADAAEALQFVAAADDEVSDALLALDDAVALQEAKILAARQAIEAAEAEATLRWVQAKDISVEVDDLRQRIQELAIDVYIGRIRPGSLLESTDLTAGVRRAAILNAITGDRGDMVDRLRALESDLEDVALSADEAIADAQANQRELESSIRVLDRRISAKENIKGELQDRIAAYEAEIRTFERQEYLMAILIDNLIAEELRKSAPDLSKESGQGFIMPMEGKIGSRFGPRIHPIFGTMRQHNGVDIGCVRGQPIWAAKAGKVIFAGWKNGYGNVVLLEHEGPVITLYAHQEKIHVSAGYRIGKGEVLGTCGSTGWSTGPHLHFEVRTGGQPKDPMIILPG